MLDAFISLKTLTFVNLFLDYFCINVKVTESADRSRAIASKDSSVAGSFANSSLAMRTQGHPKTSYLSSIHGSAKFSQSVFTSFQFIKVRFPGKFLFKNMVLSGCL